MKLLLPFLFSVALSASTIPPSDPSGAPDDPPITTDDLSQAYDWYGPVQMNTAGDLICYGDVCAPIESTYFAPPVSEDFTPPVYPPTPKVPVSSTPEPRVPALPLLLIVGAILLLRRP
jgi:hypothetical protein